MTLTSKAAYRISLVFGVLLVALLFYSQGQPKLEPCGGLAPGYAPVIAFELARSVSDLQAIFGAAPGVCRTALAQKMDALTWADCIVFIPLYGGFLFFFFFGMRSREPRLAKIALWLVIAALLADYAENACLLALSQSPDSPSAWLSLLPFATGIKWLALGIASALAGIILALRGGLNYLPALVCLLGFAGAVAALINPAAFGAHISDGIGLGWLVFFFLDIREAVRR